MQSGRGGALYAAVALALSLVDPRQAHAGGADDAGSPPRPGVLATIDSELALGSLLRSRLTVGCIEAPLPLSFFLIDVENASGRRLDFGAETSYLAIGPCSSYGFLSRLSSPRLAPVREPGRRSELRLDRSFEGGPVHGLVLRLPGDSPQGFGTFLYLTERSSPSRAGALAPESESGADGWSSAWAAESSAGTAGVALLDLLGGAGSAKSELRNRAAGIGIVAGREQGLSFELLAQMTGFPTAKRSEDWFTREPLFPGGSALHAGARASYHRGLLTLAEEGSISLCPYLPAAAALSTDLTLDTGRIRASEGAEQRFILRAQGECIGPGYVTSYESYVGDALLGRVCAEWRLAKLTLSAEGEAEVGQLPQIPTPFRRLGREGTLSAELELSRLTLEAGWRQRRTDGEDGSLRFTQSAIGGLSFTGRRGSLCLEAISSRDEGGKGRLDARARGVLGSGGRNLSAAVTAEEGHVDLEAGCEIGAKDFVFSARIAGHALLEVERDFATLTPGPFFSSPAANLEITIGASVSASYPSAKAR